MSDLTKAQQDISNTVVGLSAAFLGIVAVAAMPLAAQAQRMSGYSIPSRPAPPVVTPAPVQPSPPRYQPQQPTYQPTQPTQVRYGVFNAFGPLPEGRVNVRLDSSFEQHTVYGYTVYTQDNGPEGNDQMVIDGPAGREQVWINCWVTEEWKSYGPNTEEFIHDVVSMYCDWDS